MAECTVNLELDRPDGRYAMGEKVSGTVHVRADEDCQCRKLTLRREWETSGRGNLSTGGRVDILLFEGQWTGGRDYSYRFEFDAPPGPVSQKGTLVSLDWYLRARADIPWAFDPKAERVFKLLPGPVEQVDLGYHYQPTNLPGKMHGGGVQTALGLIFIAFGSVFAIPMIRLMIEYGTFYPTARLIGGGVAMLVGAIVFYFGIRNFLAGRKLGGLNVTLEPNSIRAGEDLKCTLSFTPRGSLRLNRVTATLCGKERTVSGSGKHQSTYHHTIISRSVPVVGKVDLPSGSPVLYEPVLPVPENVPSTFAAGSNSIRWYVTVHLDIQKWPDWKRDIPFTVVP